MTSEPIEEHLARVLRYVVMVGVVGVQKCELDYFATARPPAPFRSTLQSAWQKELSTDMFWVRHEPQEVVDYFEKAGWISIRSEKCFATPLAVQLVREMSESPTSEESEAAAVIINPSDPMRYHLLAQVLAGGELLVDPYFKASQVDWLARGTSIQRVLISRSGANSVPRSAPKGTDPNQVQIQMELGRLISNGLTAPEVRITDSDSLHDRAVVYGDRPTALLGTSLSGVATHLSVYTPLPQAASDTYTPELEAMWSAAIHLEPRDRFDPPMEKGAEVSAPDGEPQARA